MEHKIYKNKVITVVTEKIKKRGRSFEAFKIVENNVVVILPIMDGKVIMERQYRYAVGKYIYELPAGHIEPGEDPKVSSIRELEEETGYLARKVVHMFDSFTSPGSSTVKYLHHLAYDITKSKRHMDADEIIDVKLFPMAKVMEMVKNNEIEDTKTVAAILYYDKFLKSKKR